MGNLSLTTFCGSKLGTRSTPFSVTDAAEEEGEEEGGGGGE